MKIESVIVGILEENCYILKKGSECLIIDPGDEFSKIKKAVEGYKPVGCLITHFHQDHIGALEEVLSTYDLEINKVKSSSFKFKTIATPGHTSESKTFYFEEEKIMFTGDFVFKDGIGRTDLGGNMLDMQDSIRLILNYPDDITLYPGHGPSTTLKEEKENLKYYI